MISSTRSRTPVVDVVGHMDRSILRQLTAHPGTAKAAFVERVAPLADHVKPWLVATPILLAVRRRPRSVLRAWLAIVLAAAASATASAAIGRDRPAAVVRDRAHAADRPASRSMPSTHTANAAAFVAALAVDDRDAMFALLSVAAFVAWSRVAAARHYPSDVAVGALLGAAIGSVVTRATVWLAGHPGRAGRSGS